MGAAERAFRGWSETPSSERGGLLKGASELLMERQADIAALVTEETNGTLGWGMFNVQLGAGMLGYYAGQADAPAEEQEIPSHIPGKRAKAVRQPVGVVVGIAPWNAPVVLGVRAVAAPLAYGNTVVLKASEQCPRTHAAIVDALKDAGVPAGAITLVTNEPEDAAEVVEELIAHPAASERCRTSGRAFSWSTSKTLGASPLACASCSITKSCASGSPRRGVKRSPSSAQGRWRRRRRASTGRRWPPFRRSESGSPFASTDVP